MYKDTNTPYKVLRTKVPALTATSKTGIETGVISWPPLTL